MIKENGEPGRKLAGCVVLKGDARALTYHCSIPREPKLEQTTQTVMLALHDNKIAVTF